jgi:hypothetical protein
VVIVVYAYCITGDEPKIIRDGYKKWGSIFQG